ncbi:MAG: cation:proton antiporter [Pirellulales bacterium]|nr:cation:proton antiporter [Pirellulales bacterium]
MDSSNVEQLAGNLLLVLGAGLIAAAVCRRLGVSMLVGYLVAGALIGHGGLGWISEGDHSLTALADAGVLLLLFSIGMELSFESLRHAFRWIVGGGTVQMFLVAAPVALAVHFMGIGWSGAVLVGCAVAFSSTVLVFKALAEWGQSTSPHGRRAIGILLFQDVALVPLILLIPMLTGETSRLLLHDLTVLILQSALLVSVVAAFRHVIRRWVAPALQKLRSVELVMLFTLTILGAFCLVAQRNDLPPMLGALAAGVALGGNRLTRQIDALILPYRETFAAVFFVSLGTLMRFDVVSSAGSAALAMALLAGVLALKTAAAAASLRLTGLRWRGALGTGLGLAQMGEFSFVLLLIGEQSGLMGAAHRDLVMFVALGTLILTPQLLKSGLKLAGRTLEQPDDRRPATINMPRHAIVVGAGPIGRQVTSQLEISGIDVCLIDFSSVNLHGYALQGFHTIAGDGSDPLVLRRADVEQCSLVVVTVAQDMAAENIVLSVRQLSRTCKIVVRCRYQANVARIRRAGANQVVSEESEASDAMVRFLQEM